MVWSGCSDPTVVIELESQLRSSDILFHLSDGGEVPIEFGPNRASSHEWYMNHLGAFSLVSIPRSLVKCSRHGVHSRITCLDEQYTRGVVIA
jgi:hypothetical protein